MLDQSQVLVRDGDSRIVLWTRGTERLYGYSRSEALSRISHELLRTEFPQPMDHGTRPGRAKYAIVSYILHMWITRALNPVSNAPRETRPVVVLTGARQTGKTSTFLRLFPKHAFVSLDRPAEAEQAEKEPGTFLQRHPPPVLIDEVQYAPGLFRHLKVAVDAHRTRNGQFLLTGSQKFTLMKNVSESLAGRADIVELETLSFAEIQGALPQTRIETAVVRGGFPGVVCQSRHRSCGLLQLLSCYVSRTRCSLLNQCWQSAGLREISARLRTPFCKSLEQSGSCAPCRHSPFNSEPMAVDAGSSGQVVLLEPWFSNRTKSIVKSPKLYLADTGLLCALLNIRSKEALQQSPAVGAVWETFVFAQLRDREHRSGRTGSLFFWRDRTREVDFVVDAGGRLELFEAKWTELPDSATLRISTSCVMSWQITYSCRRCRVSHPKRLSACNGFRAPL